MNTFVRPAVVLSLLASAGCAAPSPDVVVTQAIEAARNNDREAFLACFTAGSRPLLETFWRSLERADAQLAQLGAKDARVIAIEGLPQYEGEAARAIVTVAEGDTQVKLLTLQVGSMWRIDLLGTERLGRDLMMKF